MKPHLSIIFIGHVDSGKSTLAGNILYMTGQVTNRDIEKHKKDAMNKAGESWFLSYITDTDEEEQEKGKTIEVGRCTFETDNRRYTILDAPGHRNYVPNMVVAASQADIGILVISARSQEFERGFDKLGQTREHVLIVRTFNINRLIVVINKMDEVNWSEIRYNEICQKLQPFLSKFKFKTIDFIPISAQNGNNIFQSLSPLTDWYKGKTLIQVLDDMDFNLSNIDYPLRICVLDKCKDQGCKIILGAIKSGTVSVGQELIVCPSKDKLKVLKISTNFHLSLDNASVGEHVYLNVKDIDIDSIKHGDILTPVGFETPIATKIRVDLNITNIRPNNPIYCKGSIAVMHLHTLTTQVTFDKIISVKDSPKSKPCFVKLGARCIVDLIIDHPIPCETYSTCNSLSRFTLRDQELTLAIGKIIKIIN